MAKVIKHIAKTSDILSAGIKDSEVRMLCGFYRKPISNWAGDESVCKKCLKLSDNPIHHKSVIGKTFIESWDE